jgi:hypothetical protein
MRRGSGIFSGPGHQASDSELERGGGQYRLSALRFPEPDGDSSARLRAGQLCFTVVGGLRARHCDVLLPTDAAQLMKAAVMTAF